MASIRITDLPVAQLSDLTNADKLIMIDAESGVSKQLSFDNLAQFTIIAVNTSLSTLLDNVSIIANTIESIKTVDSTLSNSINTVSNTFSTSINAVSSNLASTANTLNSSINTVSGNVISLSNTFSTSINAVSSNLASTANTLNSSINTVSDTVAMLANTVNTGSFANVNATGQITQSGISILGMSIIL